MANILVVSANLKNWIKDSGGKERTANLMEALTEHDITFLSFAWDGEAFEKRITDNIYQIQLETPTHVINSYRKLIKDIAKVNYDICFELLKDDLSLIPKVNIVGVRSYEGRFCNYGNNNVVISISKVLFDMGSFDLIYKHAVFNI